MIVIEHRLTAMGFFVSVFVSPFETLSSEPERSLMHVAVYVTQVTPEYPVSVSPANGYRMGEGPQPYNLLGEE